MERGTNQHIISVRPPLLLLLLLPLPAQCCAVPACRTHIFTVEWLCFMGPAFPALWQGSRASRRGYNKS